MTVRVAAPAAWSQSGADKIVRYQFYANQTLLAELPGGAEKVFSILGEWDSEPSLGILSCSTPLARALLDCREGDTVELPAENEEGTVEGVVKSVGALSEDILAWSRG